MINFRLLAEFTLIYAALTAAGQFLNNILVVTPTYGLNIAVTVIATIIVLKRRQIPNGWHSSPLLLAVNAGLCALASLYVLSYFVASFPLPSLFESSMSFLVNAAAAGGTTYFITSTRQHNNQT